MCSSDDSKPHASVCVCVFYFRWRGTHRFTSMSQLCVVKLRCETSPTSVFWENVPPGSNKRQVCFLAGGGLIHRCGLLAGSILIYHCAIPCNQHTQLIYHHFHLHIHKHNPGINSALTVLITCSPETCPWVSLSLSVCRSEPASTCFCPSSSSAESNSTHFLTLVLLLSNSAMFQTPFPQHNSNAMQLLLLENKVRFISKCQIWQVNSMRPH